MIGNSAMEIREEDHARRPAVPAKDRRSGVLRIAKLRMLLYQLLLLAVVLAAWQFLPDISFLRSRSHIFDRFFVSSPELVAIRIFDYCFGYNHYRLIWHPLWLTFSASILGCVIGLVGGAAIGLVLSNSRFLGQLFRPYVFVVNSIPRIAMIPLIILLVGATYTGSIANGVSVAFFVAFFAAYEGGIAVPRDMISNAKILGASSWDILRLLRFPYVIVWTFGSLPLILSFSLIGVLTGEILTGYGGLGELFDLTETQADATGTFAIVLILAILGVLALAAAMLFKRRLLHWWETD